MMFIPKFLTKNKVIFKFSTVAPIIDFSDFENRKKEIGKEMWKAATNTGFMAITNHGIP